MSELNDVIIAKQGKIELLAERLYEQFHREEKMDYVDGKELDPNYETVRNYADMIKQHTTELQTLKRAARRN